MNFKGIHSDDSKKRDFLKVSLSKEGKLKECVTSSLTHKDWLKKIFQTKGEKEI